MHTLCIVRLSVCVCLVLSVARRLVWGGGLALLRTTSVRFLLSAGDVACPRPMGLLTVRVDETVGRLPLRSVPFFALRSFVPGIVRSFPIRPVSAEPRALAVTCPRAPPPPSVLSQMNRTPCAPAPPTRGWPGKHQIPWCAQNPPSERGTQLPWLNSALQQTLKLDS